MDNGKYFRFRWLLLSLLPAKPDAPFLIPRAQRGRIKSAPNLVREGEEKMEKAEEKIDWKKSWPSFS